MKGISGAEALVEDHRRRHPELYVNDIAVSKPVADLIRQAKPRRLRLNKTEAEYALILEAMKRRGEINEYRFEGITLRWAEDSETGRAMRFTPDFAVWKNASGDVEFHEVKGAFIRQKDWIRFRGCKSDWPRYHFELWQKREGQWARLL